jgi:transposase
MEEYSQLTEDERYHIDAYKAAGFSIKDICDQLGVAGRTIGNWIQRFMLGGINGLFDKKRSGRPPKMTKTQRRTLAKIIERGPKSSRVTGSVTRAGSSRGPWSPRGLPHRSVPAVFPHTPLQ